MWGRPTAIGYLRRDVSGVSQVWDETQNRSVAARLGYNLAKTITFGSDVLQPIDALLKAVKRAGAEAVIVPSTAHFEGNAVPDELIRQVDVITVSPEHTFARWPLHPARWSSPHPTPADGA